MPVRREAAPELPGVGRGTRAQWEGLFLLTSPEPTSRPHSLYSHPHTAPQASSLHCSLLPCSSLYLNGTCPSPGSSLLTLSMPRGSCSPWHQRCKPLPPLLGSLCPGSCLPCSTWPTALRLTRGTADPAATPSMRGSSWSKSIFVPWH